MRIDAHCHLDLYSIPRNALRKRDADGIVTMAVTTAPRFFSQLRDESARMPFVLPAVGCHPDMVARHIEYIDMDVFFAHAANRTRFIGEVGMDGSDEVMRSRLDYQEQLFRHILHRLAGKGCVYSIHSRKAESRVIQLLRDTIEYEKDLGTERRKRSAFILHWFTGSEAQLRKAVEIGCMFSVNYRVSKRMLGYIRDGILPIDRLLTETDGPFARGMKDGRFREALPDDMTETYGKLAEALDIPIGGLMQVVESNWNTLLQIDGPS